MASPSSSVPLAALIDGKGHVGQELFESKNPADTRQVVGVYAKAPLDMCRHACQRATAGYEPWSQVPAPVRAQVLDNLATLLKKNKEALSRLITSEVGKPLGESRGEVQEAIDTAQFFLSEGRRLYGQTVPSEMPLKELSTYRRSMGVVACITAANFPCAVPSWYLIPALLCGNTVVWKPSEDAPKVAEEFARLLFAAGLPHSALHVVFGDGSTGAALVSLVGEGLVQKVGFTGSSVVGSKIGEFCGRHLQTPCLELGGKNPLVIMPDANLDLALEGVVWSAFGTAGQRCTSLGNLLVHSSIAGRLTDKLLKAVQSIAIGDPLIEKYMYGPMISQKYLHNHVQNLNTLIAPHHTVLTSTNGAITTQNAPQNFGGDAVNGLYAFPTIVSGVTSEDLIYQQETFGPLINVLEFSDIEEAVFLSNHTGYGLSSSIYTNDVEVAYRYRVGVKAGMLSINNGTIGAEAHLPFGGNGKSGNGSRQSGIWVIDQFTRWQSVNWDCSGRLQKAQVDTITITPTDYAISHS